jgi:hypothetical protein
MMKYLSTNNIENIKYQLSVLKNNPEIGHKQKEIVNQSESFIQNSKLASRMYCILEFSWLLYSTLYKKSNFFSKSTYMVLRISSFWLLTNLATNLYLKKQMEKLGAANSKDFKKYISNRIV